MARRRLITLLLAILLGGSIHAAAPNFVCLLHTTLEVQDQPYVIYFGPGSAAVASRFRPTLIDVAAVLAAQPSWRIDIAGHSDALEDGTNNLSKRRAAAVRQLLVDQYHVAAERLNVLNFPASTIISGMRAENRRVEFVVAR